MKNLIELDEYLDLTELDIINSEFIDTIDKVPTEYTEMFTANIVQDNNITYSDGVNVLFLSDLPSDIYDEFCYEQIDKSIYWEDLPVYDYFPRMRKFISTLPFESIGRIFITYSKDQFDTHIHRDHEHECRNEFIWLRLNKNKRFFVLVDGEYEYIEGNSCWFDSRKQHGSDSLGKNGASVRIDGKFISTFRKELFGNGSKWEKLPCK